MMSLRNFLSFIIVLLITASSLIAQDWKPVRLNSLNIYRDPVYNYLPCTAYRIDSVYASGADTVYKSYNSITTPSGMYNDCYSPVNGSWIGKRIVQKCNGRWYFINYNNDSIFINTHANTGDSWTFYRYPLSTDKIIATVSSVGISAFLGLTDSIKTITLSAVDSSGNGIAWQYNGQDIILSRNYGLVKTMNFFNFPDYSGSFFNSNLKVMSLAGMSDPQTGIQNLTMREVYDYMPGDEFHLHSYQTHTNVWGFPHSYSISTESWTLTKVLSKLTYATQDTLGYEFEICKKNWYQYGSQDSNYTTNSFTHDTVDVVVFTSQDAYNTKFNNPPSMVVWDTSQGIGIIYEKPLTTGYGGLRIKHDYGTQYNGYTTDSCWNEVLADGCVGIWSCAEGIYGMFFWCQYGFDEELNELVAYKKNGIIWGSPYSCSQLSEEEYPMLPVISMNVFPNPTSDRITIKLSRYAPGLTAEITDMYGRLCAKVVLSSAETGLNCGSFPSGLYICRITDKGSRSAGQKFMVIH